MHGRHLLENRGVFAAKGEGETLLTLPSVPLILRVFVWAYLLQQTGSIRDAARDLDEE